MLGQGDAVERILLESNLDKLWKEYRIGTVDEMASGATDSASEEERLRLDAFAVCLQDVNDLLGEWTDRCRSEDSFIVFVEDLLREKEKLGEQHIRRGEFESILRRFIDY